MTQSSDSPTTAAYYTDAETGELKTRQFNVRVVKGPDAGQERALEVGTTVVGTHANTDLVLTDETVSRYHLELRTRRGGVDVVDLETTNGTFHGETRVGSISVREATRLRLGKHTIIELVPQLSTIGLEGYRDDRFGHVVGASEPMRRMFALLARVAPTDTTLLLEGETGTGKEAIAEEVHRQSERSDRQFAVVDCAAIPRHLIGSELFGHVRGAFTSADSDKQGLIEGADQGTLFLDEIGELDLELQPQLLRVLEKREVRRVGDTRARPVDIRIIAATNRNLEEMVSRGEFREDLYYRLAVVRAVVPPLRERRDDLPLLAHNFADKLGFAYQLSPTLIAELKNHDWPGNVRELRNVVERALSLGIQGVIQSPGVLGATPAASDSGSMPRAPHDEMLDMPFKQAKNALIEAFERDYLEHLLTKHKGNISRAANEAGIDRNYIHRLVKKYGINVSRN